MGVRSCAKAIVLNGGKLLAVRCRDERNGEYFTLPGGGQNAFETLPEAAVRECLEETGYAVAPGRLVAVSEEIFDDPEVRERYPGYAHRLYHVFLCGLAREQAAAPAGADRWQIGIEWLKIGDVKGVRLFPKAIADRLPEILAAENPVYLGCERAAINHG